MRGNKKLLLITGVTLILKSGFWIGKSIIIIKYFMFITKVMQVMEVKHIHVKNLMSDIPLTTYHP